jgi:hypothetical protein
LIIGSIALVSTASGCRSGCQSGCGRSGGLFGRRAENIPPVDPPFPVGQVTDSFWETQQTNAEAADFIFYDHEFVGDTDKLAPGATKKLMQVALRLEHVPFPIVIEETPYNADPDLDQDRRRRVVEELARLGVEQAEDRVVITSAYARGLTAVEGERAYYTTLQGDFGGGGGIGRRFGGFGGYFR